MRFIVATGLLTSACLASLFFALVYWGTQYTPVFLHFGSTTIETASIASLSRGGWVPQTYLLALAALSSFVAYGWFLFKRYALGCVVFSGLALGATLMTLSLDAWPLIFHCHAWGLALLFLFIGRQYSRSHSSRIVTK